MQWPMVMGAIVPLKKRHPPEAIGFFNWSLRRAAEWKTLKRNRKAVQNSVQLPLRTQDILSLAYDGSQEYSYVLFDAVCMLTPYNCRRIPIAISTGYRPGTSRVILFLDDRCF